MSDDQVAVVLDATALAAYVDGRVAVGELIAEVADEGRTVGVPAACLAAAYAASSSEVSAALLTLLTTTPTVTVLPLGAELGVDDARQVGILARAAGGDIALGHAARTAIAHQAHLATTATTPAAAVLPGGWSILDLSQE
ncbi:hypothetical protein GCM10029963_79670 [Micromonospora andamanensis]|uniref:hypothetical protein n=1 Tax=Micromonospora andamanensis TaxID=1287068 RepID=UPI00194DEE28|nr:hypothetical protein [Micromonospora andamanensis]GIJ40548.1 hypothetical protein Vwe01_38730 [Micromonospora andamanensis]